MNGSLGGRVEDALAERVARTASDFSSITTYVSVGDKVLGPAPEILGKMYATKQELREENKDPSLSEAVRKLNLTRINLLDLQIKLRTQECAPSLECAHVLVVCTRGRLFVRRKCLHLLPAEAA